MTDFIRWLYANYIWPHIKAQDATGYETPLSLLEGCLDDALKKEYHRTLEFYAGRPHRRGIGGSDVRLLCPKKPVCLTV